MDVHDLPTPALLIDDDVLDRQPGHDGRRPARGRRCART